MWSWLRKSPSLPPVSIGRYWGSRSDVIKIVQGLGDIETLTAYLLLVWSEWEGQSYKDEMCGLIKSSLSGIRMGYYRKELLQHLDHVLGQLELGLDHLQQHDPRLNEGDIQWRQEKYEKLKKVLLEVDKEAVKLLICESSRLVILFSLLNSCGQLKDPTQCLCVQSLLHFCSYMSGTFPITSPAP